MMAGRLPTGFCHNKAAPGRRCDRHGGGLVTCWTRLILKGPDFLWYGRPEGRFPIMIGFCHRDVTVSSLRAAPARPLTVTVTATVGDM
jgi:hypothetical protein